MVEKELIVHCDKRLCLPWSGQACKMRLVDMGYETIVDCYCCNGTTRLLLRHSTSYIDMNKTSLMALRQFWN